MNESTADGRTPDRILPNDADAAVQPDVDAVDPLGQIWGDRDRFRWAGVDWSRYPKRFGRSRAFAAGRRNSGVLSIDRQQVF